MSFDYRLALMTGVDIPIPEIGLVLHQPTLQEISRLGETEFFIGIQVLCINKTMYIEDQALLDQTTNFQIFTTMMNEKQMADKKQNVLQTLMLLFPSYTAMITPRSLVLQQKQTKDIITIDESNFEILQKLFSTLFCLENAGQQAFNPADKKAKEIAEKLMRGRQRVAAQKESGSGSMFSQYLSILTVGLQSMSLKDTIELTMYQLYDLVERYMLYVNWDLDVKTRLAGGKPDKPVDNWMKQIH